MALSTAFISLNRKNGTEEKSESNKTSRKAAKYRSDLQGIRALAITAVLLFHFYPLRFPNGYLGVDQ
uniref:Acyl_transf_3 domain-containing protein n=1 Tax=Angiostrongylus cantonensis TaxID=6313 RepID=A0A0K0D0D2_ANGCA